MGGWSLVRRRMSGEGPKMWRVGVEVDERIFVGGEMGRRGWWGDEQEAGLSYSILGIKHQEAAIQVKLIVIQEPVTRLRVLYCNHQHQHVNIGLS